MGDVIPKWSVAEAAQYDDRDPDLRYVRVRVRIAQHAAHLHRRTVGKLAEVEGWTEPHLVRDHVSGTQRHDPVQPEARTRVGAFHAWAERGV